MAIRWDERLETGNDFVDNQHKELIRRLNLFIDACDGGQGKDYLIGLLQFLDDYIHSHFAEEEQLLEEMKFAFRAAHRQHHQDFVRDFTVMKKRFLMEGPSGPLVADIRDFVVGWLLHHILEKDMSFSQMKRRTEEEGTGSK